MFKDSPTFLGWLVGINRLLLKAVKVTIATGNHWLPQEVVLALRQKVDCRTRSEPSRPSPLFADRT